MKLPAQSRTPRWNSPSRTSSAARRTRRRSLSQPSDFMVRWISSVDESSCTRLPPLENLPNSRFLPRRWQRVGKMGVAARTVVKIMRKTPATTAGGAGTGSKRQRGGWTAWIDQGAPGPFRRALGAKALVGTSGANRVERRQRGRDSRECHPRNRPSTVPKWKEKNGCSVLALSSLAKIRTSQSQA